MHSKHVRCWNNHGYVGLLPALDYYELDDLTESTCSKLIEWHGSTQTTSLCLIARFTNTVRTADVALLKSGCMKFMASFLRDTGIGPFHSCTIVGACMHMFCTYHLNEKNITRLSDNGYRSMRNYSNKSMGWSTYCDRITGDRYKHSWFGGYMYLKEPML